MSNIIDMLDHKQITDQQVLVATERLRRWMTDPAVDLSIRHRKRDGKIYLRVKAIIKETPLRPHYLPYDYSKYINWIVELFPMARITSGTGSSLKIDQTFRIGSSVPRVKSQTKKLRDSGLRQRVHQLVINCLAQAIDADVLAQWLEDDDQSLDNIAKAVTAAVTDKYKLVAKH